MKKMSRTKQSLPPNRPARRPKRWLLAALLPLLTGCPASWQDELALKLGWKKPPEEPKPQTSAAKDPLLGDTIGAQVLLSEADATGLRVQGFSIVVGLGENGGSGDCPTAIRDYLIEYFNKLYGPEKKPREGQPRFSAARLIDSADCAVVQISGLIPPGAPRGTHFDLLVEAVPGTQTRSLEGGLLLPCELRQFDPATGGRGLFAGPVLARAQGPIFTNPFNVETGGGTPDLRRGFVLGGGGALEDRPVRLALTEPAPNLARLIERRVNERFGPPKIADAQSKGLVTVRAPASLAKQPERITRLAMHQYLSNQPAFYESKLRDLTEMIVQPNASYENIGLIWEALGRVAIPQIQPLYLHKDPQVSFYAARAGLRLKDVEALPVLAQIAATPGHPQRLAAVREMGLCDYPPAAQKLVPLLNDLEQEIRIAAYEALLDYKHSAIKTRAFRSALDPDALNLYLDTIESNGKPLIYVRRSRVPRIAVFGPRIPVTLPVFYSDAQDRVTLNAGNEARDITVFTRGKQGRKASEPLLVPPRVPDLIAALADLPVKDEAGRLRGIGQGYSQIVQVLATLCHDGTVPAQVVVEQMSLTELLGPTLTTPPERPEGDVPSSAAPTNEKQPLLPEAPPARPESTPEKPEKQP